MRSLSSLRPRDRGRLGRHCKRAARRGPLVLNYPQRLRSDSKRVAPLHGDALWLGGVVANLPTRFVLVRSRRFLSASQRNRG